MNSKALIVSIIIMLLGSFVFLSFHEFKKADIDKTNTWMLYFNDPKNGSLDFTIENHSKNPNFHWEIYLDKAEIREGDINVLTSEKKTIPVANQNIESKKITIVVTAKDVKKEIYKAL